MYYYLQLVVPARKGFYTLLVILAQVDGLTVIRVGACVILRNTHLIGAKLNVVDSTLHVLVRMSCMRSVEPAGTVIRRGIFVASGKGPACGVGEPVYVGDSVRRVKTTLAFWLWVVSVALVQARTRTLS